MNLKITTTQKEDHIFIEVIGEYSIKDFRELVVMSINECTQSKFNKAIVDIRKVTGKISDLDRYHLGIQTANIWNYKNKMALVYREEEINNFFDDVAINRSANVKTFPTVEEAYAWLAPPF